MINRRTMILFYISIPIMVLAVAIATLPLVAAMRIESRMEWAYARSAKRQDVASEESLEAASASPGAASDEDRRAA